MNAEICQLTQKKNINFGKNSKIAKLVINVIIIFGFTVHRKEIVFIFYTKLFDRRFI